LEGIRSQYTHGVANPERVRPESYTLDTALLERPGNKDIQLDLFLDYSSNVKLYPKFQEYLRKSKPPLLAIWGKNDPFFIPAGAEAFRKDLPNAQVQFLDTGHFAIETHVVEIASAMRDFLGKSASPARSEKALFHDTLLSSEFDNLIAEDDRMINPKTQRFMVDRMGATVRSHHVDHTPMISEPAVVTEIILEAARKTLSV
jgi:pimeloyl-ACP methyl ester carboxylesterase